MYKDSYNRIKAIKNSFNDLIDNIKEIKDQLEDVYINTYREVREEITQKQEEYVHESEETKRIYNQLDFDICSKLIKKILPLRVRLFNKIHCCGTNIENGNTIQVAFYFNDKNEYIYYYSFAPYQIRLFLHIK
ncbi:hypothetical protein ACFHWD_03285 [Clostridium sp. MT-14]|uniref:hypothetical protein n=1 Tax=Clostridium sp. MT-14 TaxID=3348360 RepID=UPI0035F40959